MLEAVPYQVHTILTDRAIGTPLVRETMARGIQFAEQPRNRNTIHSRPMRFDMICEGQPRFATGSRPLAGGIEHRLTKPNHPWSREDQKTVRGSVFLSGGQVERLSRTIKDTTVKRFHNETNDPLRTQLADFLAAYNFARRLKTLNGLTPYEYICKIWTSEPDRFIRNPIHQMPGLKT